MNTTARQLAVLQQLRPFLQDDAAYGRLYGDLHDLLEMSAWLIKKFADIEGRSLSTSELESLLIDIDINFIQHASYHLSSLSKDLTVTLRQFPDETA